MHQNYIEKIMVVPPSFHISSPILLDFVDTTLREC